MKKLIISIQLLVAGLVLTTNVASAQLKIMIIKQGNYQTEIVPAGCTCGQAQFDCVCGISGYSNYTSVSEIHLTKGQIYAIISSQVISENTLQIKFKDKLNMKLRSSDFIQKQEVYLDASIANSLGYDSVAILPGKYTIRDGKSMTLNLKRYHPFKCNCFGGISTISPVGELHKQNDWCWNFGALGTAFSWPCHDIHGHHKDQCCDRVQAAVHNLSATQWQSIADCLCANGTATGTTIEAYTAVGSGLGGPLEIGTYDNCDVLGTLVNQPLVTKTTCTCPKGWLANETNVDGGVTADGKCKKGVCGPFIIANLPPDGTPVGTWGFTWNNGLYAWGTTENGGAAICHTTVITPKVCKIQR